MRGSPRPTRGGLPESAFRVEGDLVRDHLALVVEKCRCAVRPLSEANPQVVHAVQQRVRGLLAGPRILAGEEVGVVAVRGRMRQLVAVGRPDGPELTVVSGEIVDRPRREAVRVEPASPAQAKAATSPGPCAGRAPGARRGWRRPGRCGAALTDERLAPLGLSARRRASCVVDRGERPVRPCRVLGRDQPRTGPGRGEVVVDAVDGTAGRRLCGNALRHRTRPHPRWPPRPARRPMAMTRPPHPAPGHAGLG